MRWLAPLLLLLASCNREPSFDQRYSDMANEIENRASNLDAELNRAQPANDQST